MAMRNVIDIYTGEVLCVVPRTPYNYDVDAVSKETGLECKDPTRTVQESKDECDINVILERFGITGELPVNLRMPLQEEFYENMSYQDALAKIKAADDAFMQLPANVRERFQNNPGMFVDFASNPANLDECRRLGLAPEVLAKVESPPAAPSST